MSLPEAKSKYLKLVQSIGDTIEGARNRAIKAFNTELLEANWEIKKLLFLLLICSSCNRPKETTVTESLQPAPIVEDSYVYYPIIDNRIKVDLNKPQKASLFDYFSRIEFIIMILRQLKSLIKNMK